MTDDELLAEMGTDAQRWATAFTDRVAGGRLDPSDRDSLVTWFANAIEVGGVK